MEDIIKEMETKMKLLQFTHGKTQGIVAKANVEGMERQRYALRAMVKEVDAHKIQIEQAKFHSGDKPKYVAEWSHVVEEQLKPVDADVSFIEKYLAEAKLEARVNSKQSEEAEVAKAREGQLEFERAKL